MKDRIRQLLKSSLARNAAANGILKPLSMLISYISVPIVLRFLGDEKYGAWAAILSVLSWISYFDLGIGNGLRNKLTEAIAHGDRDKCKKLISSAYVMLTVIVVIFSAVMIGVASFLDWNSVLGMKEHYDGLKTAVILSILFVSLNFILSVCKSILFALQRASLCSLLDITSQLLNLTALLIVSSFTSGSLLLVSIISGGTAILSSIIFTVILFARHKELIPSRRYADLAVGKEVSSLGLKFFVIQISGLILFTTDSLIISYLYGAEDVTPYSIVNKIFMAIIVLHSSVLIPFWSAMTQAKAENDIQKIRKFLRSCEKLMLPFFAAAIVASLVFRPLTSFWLGKELDYGSLLIPFGTVYCCAYIWCNTFGVLASGLSIMRAQMVIAVSQAAVNIPLSLLFAKAFSMDSAGILLGTVCSMLIGAAAIPFVLIKYLRSSEQSG